MKPVLCTEETRRLESIIEKDGTSRAELMELAGEYVASVVLERQPRRVLVACGFGNNGGDGWVAADILQQKGVKVDVVTPIKPDEIKSSLARHVARRSAARNVTVHVGPARDELADLLQQADVCVDALLGIGFSGELRPPFTIWIPTINEYANMIVSVDVPSGMDADTGHVAEHCVHADATATLLSPKIGLYSGDGAEYAGVVSCGHLYSAIEEPLQEVDHAAELVEASDLFECFSALPANINKYSRGSVLVVAGSSMYPGAAIMAAKSAARAGAGYVAIATPDACANLIRMALPSIPVIPIPSDSRGAFGAAARSAIAEHLSKFDCVLCGPGMTMSAGAMQVVSYLLETDKPLIMDADALNCLARVSIDGIDTTPELYRREAPLIMTPHYRELSRLVGGEQVDDLVGAVAAAQRILWAVGSDNMLIVAKGPSTAVCGVESVYIPLSGPSCLATAGSGDVLSGILAGVMASSLSMVEDWALWASYAVCVHSYTGYAAAAEMGEKSVIATDLIDLIGPAMQLVEEEAMKNGETE